jgi:hypothetical protein
MKNIPFAFWYIDNYDTRSISKSLKEDSITEGLSIKKFENKTSKFIKKKDFFYKVTLSFPLFYNSNFSFLIKIINKIILYFKKIIS